jgi:hypothetical protein
MGCYARTRFFLMLREREGGAGLAPALLLNFSEKLDQAMAPFKTSKHRA